MNNILNIIDTHGYYLDINPDIDITALIKDGTLSSIKDLGISFMNNEYYYTYSDNRYNLCVKTKGNISYISKGDKYHA